MSKVAAEPPAVDEKHTKDIVEVGLVLTAGSGQPTLQAALVNSVIATRQWKFEAKRWSSLRYSRHSTHTAAYDAFVKIARAQTRSGTSVNAIIVPVPLRASEAKAGRNGWIPKWIFEHGAEMHTWMLNKPEESATPAPAPAVPTPDEVEDEVETLEVKADFDETVGSSAASKVAAELGRAFEAAFGSDS